MSGEDCHVGQSLSLVSHDGLDDQSVDDFRFQHM